jgi:hypothetical protein
MLKSSEPHTTSPNHALQRLAAIKKDAEQYIKDSEKTSQSLSGLTTSLGKLRALKIYKKQK